MIRRSGRFLAALLLAVSLAVSGGFVAGHAQHEAASAATRPCYSTSFREGVYYYKYTDLGPDGGGRRVMMEEKYNIYTGQLVSRAYYSCTWY